MKTIYKYTVLILMFAFACSCGDDGNEIERTLKVESNSAVFSNEAGSKTIAVEIDANDSYVVSWEGESWGRVEKLDNKIEIKVTDNNTKVLRKASVIVSLTDGWRQAVIEVTQSAENPSIFIEEDIVEFSFLPAKRVIEVTSDIKMWEVSLEEEAEWINVEEHRQSNEIVISVSENFESLLRTVSLLVTSGESVKEIVVSQEGAPYFILPYIYFENARPAVVREFELARHSTSLGGGSNRVATVYEVKSSLFSKTIYFPGFGGSNAPFGGSLIRIADKHSNDFFYSSEFDELMEENGCKFLASLQDGRRFFWHDNGPDARYHTQIVYDPSANPDGILCSPGVVKPEFEDPADTYETLPYTEIAFGSTLTQVKSWESNNGGTFGDQKPSADGKAIYIDFGVTTPNVLTRWYNVNAVSDKLYNAVQARTEFEKVFTKFSTSYVVNPNLEELLSQNGFEKHQIPGVIDATYMNRETEVVLLLYVVKDAENNQYAVFDYTDTKYDPYWMGAGAMQTQSQQVLKTNGFEKIELTSKQDARVEELTEISQHIE